VTATADVSDRSWISRAVPWAAWCVLLAPLTIVLHEMGHYAAAAWAGSPNAVLHYSWTDPGNLPVKGGVIDGVIGLAGPAVTVALSMFACAWILLRGPARWAFALAITSVSRFVVAVPYTIANIVVRLTRATMGAPAFDEYKAGTAFGWSGNALLASTVVVLAGVLVFVGRQLPDGERSVAWPGLVIGTMLGWACWMLLIGPVVLP
jgi:hypothetical protein